MFPQPTKNGQSPHSTGSAPQQQPQTQNPSGSTTGSTPTPAPPAVASPAQHQQQSAHWHSSAAPPKEHYPLPTSTPTQQHQQSPHTASAIRPDRPEMTSVHHQHYHSGQQPPDMYRLPAPTNFYQQPPGPPPPPHYQPQPPAPQPMPQSAPRQRTAIACKYCRRRKIRCSGFENSDDGRCTNCVRFSQECVFTPVSAQTQAFVPAQAVYGRGARGGVQGLQLYGAHGQRLATHDVYNHHPPQQGYTLPSPTGAYPQHPPHMYPPYPPGTVYGQPPPAGQPGRPGEKNEHGPTLPPPNQGPPSSMAPSDGHHPAAYSYPNPTNYANGGQSSPGSASTYPPHGQPYYTGGQPPRQSSPSSGRPGSDQRGSISPHGQQYAYGQPNAPPVQQPHHAPPQPGAARNDGQTPPPYASNGEHPQGKSGLSISDIVSDTKNGPQGGRSAADSDMVSALNRTNRR